MRWRLADVSPENLAGTEFICPAERAAYRCLLQGAGKVFLCWRVGLNNPVYI